MIKSCPSMNQSSYTHHLSFWWLEKRGQFSNCQWYIFSICSSCSTPISRQCKLMALWGLVFLDDYIAKPCWPQIPQFLSAFVNKGTPLRVHTGSTSLSIYWCRKELVAQAIKFAHTIMILSHGCIQNYKINERYMFFSLPQTIQQNSKFRARS